MRQKQVGIPADKGVDRIHTEILTSCDLNFVYGCGTAPEFLKIPRLRGQHCVDLEGTGFSRPDLVYLMARGFGE
ncbi:MAG: hypothetical protein HC851_13135 [Acaryochloris sp. RU_4_1]|nr:hypothetical protein [Acaryochloris sp. RU_4_1]